MDYKSENGTVLPYTEAQRQAAVEAIQEKIAHEPDYMEDADSVVDLVLATLDETSQSNSLPRGDHAAMMHLAKEANCYDSLDVRQGFFSGWHARHRYDVECEERAEKPNRPMSYDEMVEDIRAERSATEQALRSPSKGKFVAIEELKKARVMLGALREQNEVPIIGSSIDCAIEALEGKALCSNCDTFTEVPE